MAVRKQSIVWICYPVQQITNQKHCTYSIAIGRSQTRHKSGCSLP